MQRRAILGAEGPQCHVALANRLEITGASLAAQGVLVLHGRGLRRDMREGRSLQGLEHIEGAGQSPAAVLPVPWHRQRGPRAELAMQMHAWIGLGK
eukprot:5376251-Alexandrium_andersonii.AAC.1